VRNQHCGVWECRHDDQEPEDGDWERFCAECEDGRDHDDDLRADCERESE